MNQAPDNQEPVRSPGEPGPLALFRRIPAGIRWWIYSIGLTLFAFEGILDASDVGLLDEQIQGIVLGVVGLFGFTTAVANTG
ncbi:hypothetical protein [Ilumatobacter sp.]|uniref:hypothetical protein n=1 Tax=Ilumatobacter sp. TaxID=1967498 RepID=UPI003751A169